MTRSSLPVLALLVMVPCPLASQDTERLYQQACDDGDMIACNVFGLMYEAGDGVARDLLRAADLYRRACEGGALVGCTNLGLMYEAGAGVTQDPSRANGLYQVACEAGEMLACASLGAMGEARGSAQPDRFYKAGRVGDAATGAALSNAIVDVPELGIHVISDASGRIELAGLPAGRYALRAERAGYELLEGELDVPGSPDFVVLMSRDEGTDLGARGRIVGRVIDEGGDHGLSDVEIKIQDASGTGTLSDARGRFDLRNIDPGLVEIRFTRLGYAPRTATLVVQPGRTVDMSTTMFTRPIELAAIEVTVRSQFLERNGFYDRIERSTGSHFTRRDLDTIDPIDVSDLVRRVPGVGLIARSPLQPDVLYAVSRRGQTTSGPCLLPLYIDGVRSPDSNLNQIPQEQIEAIEMYNGITAPIRYGRNSCGVVLIWTVRGGGGI